ncbi:OmpA family protein [Leekyejoonella antrihumi]|uniref:OmpA family protein n=1 Tax=Leekyejoonella antrihumi TaxID=1660198 RepID=UPI001648D62C|nr:OmpA family protein [Leekyejoonella antrihumi]
MANPWRRRVAACGVAISLVAAVGAIPASAANETIPIAGTFVYSGYQTPTSGQIHGAIHAVVRIPGGTAVFYSVGGPGDSPGGVMPTVGLSTPFRVGSAWAVGIVDQQGLKFYQPMVDSSGNCMCSTVSDISASPTSLNVGWAVLPPLPPRLTKVTVDFGFGNQVDVPVTNQLPQPTVNSSTVTLGNGWPKLPSRQTISSAKTATFIRSLVSNSGNTDATTHRSANHEAIALNTDVLFAIDKAALTPRAHAALKQAAAQISAKGQGVVSIVGYTDSVGTSEHNQTLSEERAQSVLAALKRLVTKPGITFTASGKGEQDPVGDNTTTQGRQLNRRVTVSFGTGEK